MTSITYVPAGPLPISMGQPKYARYFQSASEFTVQSGCQRSLDTTHKLFGATAGLTLRGNGTSTTPNVYGAIGETWNLTTSTGMFKVWVDAAYLSTITYIEFMVSNETGVVHYQRTRTSHLNSGWNTIPIIPEIGNVNLLNYTSIQGVQFGLKLASSSDATSWATFGGVAFWPRTARKLVAIMADDGHASSYTLAGYCADANMPINLAIRPGYLGTGGEMTLAQVQECYAAGHGVVNHGSMVPDTDWGSLTRAQRITTATGGRDYLVANGLPSGSRFFVVPGAPEFEDTDDADLLGPNGILDSIGYGPYARTENDIRFNSLTDMRFLRYGSAIASGAWEADLTLIGTYGGLIMPYCHGFAPLTADATWKTGLDAVIAAKDAGTIEVVTIEQLLYGRRATKQWNTLYGRPIRTLVAGSLVSPAVYDGVTGTDVGSAASKAEQLAEDKAAVVAAKADIRKDTSILGTTGADRGTLDVENDNAAWLQTQIAYLKPSLRTADGKLKDSLLTPEGKLRQSVLLG